MNKEGTVFIIIGASGSGKTTIYNHIRNVFDSKVIIPIFDTTRERRENEVSGFDYYFISKQSFIQNQIKNKYIFTYFCHGFNYGIPSDIVKHVSNGQNIVLGVSRKLIKPIKSIFPNVKIIYIDIEYNLLVERFNKRAREKNSNEVKKRLDNAKDKIQWGESTDQIDFVISNNNSKEEFTNDIANYIMEVTNE